MKSAQGPVVKTGSHSRRTQVAAKWKYIQPRPISERKMRSYKGRQSPIRATHTIQEVRQWLSTHPGPNQFLPITEDNPELQALKETKKLSNPMLAMKRLVRKILKAEFPDYMVVYEAGEIQILSRHSIV